MTSKDIEAIACELAASKPKRANFTSPIMFKYADRAWVAQVSRFRILCMNAARRAGTPFNGNDFLDKCGFDD